MPDEPDEGGDVDDSTERPTSDGSDARADAPDDAGEETVDREAGGTDFEWADFEWADSSSEADANVEDGSEEGDSNEDDSNDTDAIESEVASFDGPIEPAEGDSIDEIHDDSTSDDELDAAKRLSKVDDLDPSPAERIPEEGPPPKEPPRTQDDESDAPPIDADGDDVSDEDGGDSENDASEEDDLDDGDGRDDGAESEELPAAGPGDVNPPEADPEPPRAQTDGEGYVGDRHGPDPADPVYPDPDEDVGGISTPPDDEEMPLADHIEEMILRLAVVLLIGSAATAIGLLWASEAIDFVWGNLFPSAAEEPPHVYHPLELWLTRIKVAALLGIMAALPMFVYQCYLFMRPGLYPHERKYYLAAVPMSVVLAGLGMVFSYYAVLPVLFRYFTFYSEGSAKIAYALGETFNLIITLTGFLAIVFQIPLFIMLAIMMGVTTRQWLADKRLYFWAAFAGLSFMFTMDPTAMAALLVALTMIVLFEGTLLLLKWTGRE